MLDFLNSAVVEGGRSKSPKGKHQVNQITIILKICNPLFEFFKKKIDDNHI